MIRGRDNLINLQIFEECDAGENDLMDSLINGDVDVPSGSFIDGLQPLRCPF